ncbi:acyl-CoA dehydrogenase type 2 [Mycobacterium lentiflavum]|uniref:Acyl-CoA dehydrogenase type 2 n=1 Tax=Mycobacterium lentiflavum TaxID=141349 RepID=A0A0E3WBJ3_MYCLN|nr:acyl-CoA dehydrogenase family protein [Mycobacterium lentiflavum]CQD07219.1 acyl-CoA dehydrogenase type 2 [Mycobacterium lentiflavum]
MSKSEQAMEQNDNQLVAHAEALQDLLRYHAASGEMRNHLTPEVIESLAASGLFRLMKPIRFGGTPTDLQSVLAVTEALGVADGSAAWVVGVAATGAWMAAHLSDDGQQEVFGGTPDSRIAGGTTEVPARRVDGGLRVSGRWSYASGADDADWAAIVATLQDTPEQPATPYWCLVPADEVTLEHTWETVGMCGTGSNTFVADDVFVPERRMLNLASLIDGAAPTPHDDEVYRMPYAPVALVGILGPLLGMGRAALELVTAKAEAKAIRYTIFDRQSESIGVQLQVADAALKLRTARLHVCDIAQVTQVAAHAHTLPKHIERAAFRAQSSMAAQCVISAINILVNVHGSASFAKQNPLQRIWRDANTAARHAGLNAAIGAEIYGKALLGIGESVSPIV